MHSMHCDLVTYHSKYLLPSLYVPSLSLPGDKPGGIINHMHELYYHWTTKNCHKLYAYQLQQEQQIANGVTNTLPLQPHVHTSTCTHVYVHIIIHAVYRLRTLRWFSRWTPANSFPPIFPANSRWPISSSPSERRTITLGLDLVFSGLRGFCTSMTTGPSLVLTDAEKGTCSSPVGSKGDTWLLIRSNSGALCLVSEERSRERKSYVIT